MLALFNLNVSMISVYVAKCIFKIGKNLNVTCVTFTNDVRNNRNTVVFEKWDLVLSQNKRLFNHSVKIEYENQLLSKCSAIFR